MCAKPLGVSNSGLQGHMGMARSCDSIAHRVSLLRQQIELDMLLQEEQPA